MLDMIVVIAEFYENVLILLFYNSDMSVNAISVIPYAYRQ